MGVRSFGPLRASLTRGGDIHAADARVMHDFKFLLEFGLDDRGTEPPPAHHGPRIRGRILELPAKSGEGVLGRQRSRDRDQEHQHCGLSDYKMMGR